MKLLIDNCISRRVAEALRDRGYEVESVADWPSDPGDRAILAYAAQNGRVVVTADGDFGELVVFERLASAGVIIFERDIVPPDHAAACVRALATYGADLLAGAVVIVTTDRIRARRPPNSA